MRSILFIINPKAGTGRKDRIENCIAAGLDRTVYEPEIRYTGKAGDGVGMARSAAARGCWAVVAVGGDGTVNEVAGGLTGSDTALGIIPCGSGDGLARHIGIPHDPSRAVDFINGAKIASADWCTVNGRPFFCTCGVGFDAFVSMQFTKSGKRGPLTYVEKTVSGWFGYRPQEYEMETDDGTLIKETALLITCANASQWGNEARIAPRASLTDGLMDVTVVRPFNLLQAGPLAFRLMNGTIDRSPLVRTFRCRSLRITRTSEGPAHFDGDPTVMGRVLDVNVIHQGLKILVPAH